MNYLKLITHIGLFVFLFPIKAFTVLKHVDFSFDITVKHDTALHSRYLDRSIVLDIVLPPGYAGSMGSYKVLYMNDGQDLDRLRMLEVLEKIYRDPRVEPFVLVAVHCGERIQEYGIAAQPDYKQRGAKAGSYTAFVLKELMPYIQKNFRVAEGAQNTVFCGFSLGGLSAFDIVWHYPELFGKAGVFSGSFWWRQKAYENHYDDHNDRIMHRLVRESTVYGLQFTVNSSQSADAQSADAQSADAQSAVEDSSPTVNHKPQPSNPKSPIVNSPKFWLQTGTEDEKDDRNHNGVIDSIEDTLDLIAELEKKGFRWGSDVRYVEVKGGHHDQETWSAIMPDFLTWAFGKTQ
ncbi:MAG: alpha/beta hydrolase-fold protein [Spirosomataceae bacterium]